MLTKFCLLEMPVHRRNATELRVWSEPKTAQNASFPAMMYFFAGVNDVPLNFGSKTSKNLIFEPTTLHHVITAKFQVQV